MTDEAMEKRVDKLEDESRQYLEDITTIKTQINGIEKDASETKIIVSDLRDELIDGEKKALIDYASITSEMKQTITSFKGDMERIVNDKPEHVCLQKETIKELKEFKDQKVLNGAYKTGKKKAIDKILHYLWVPFGIVVYVFWDKFLAKMIYKLFS